jgi:NDP-sugar pyrophosphorylase family protein
VVVMNGDVQFAPDLARAVEVHRRARAIATMVLVPEPGGAVELDAEGRVCRILGVGRGACAPLDRTGRGRASAPLHRAGRGRASAPLHRTGRGRASAPVDRTGRGRASAPLHHMFTGVHVLDPRAFRDLPESGCIIRTAYFAWLERGETIAGVVDPGPFADLGTLDAYLDANVALAEGRSRVPPPLALPAVHPGAHVGQGARITSSIVGEGARVAEGVRLTRCVLWPGAEALDDAEDTIFTKRGAVRVSRRP